MSKFLYNLKVTTMHISEAIEQASNAVTDIQITYNKSLENIMFSDDFSREQKLLILKLIEPIKISIAEAQNKFSL